MHCCWRNDKSVHSCDSGPIPHETQMENTTAAIHQHSTHSRRPQSLRSPSPVQMGEGQPSIMEENTSPLQSEHSSPQKKASIRSSTFSTGPNDVYTLDNCVARLKANCQRFANRDERKVVSRASELKKVVERVSAKINM